MRSRTTPRTVALLLATAAVMLMAASTPAAASAEDCAEGDSCAVPRCYSETIHARAGLARAREVTCSWADSVELTDAPEHGSITDFEFRYGYQLRFTHRADDDAPADDSFELTLTGPGGTRTQTVRVVVVPDSVNTAPACDPVEVAERTLGLEPPRLGFYVYCWDAEYDDFTVEGGGPGQSSSPVHEPADDNGQISWSYTPVTADGSETTTYWATDSQGARSADAAISVRVGRSVDRLPTCGYEWNGRWGQDFGMRAGAARRFGIICRDLDGDPLVAPITRQPEHGVAAAVPGPPNVSSYWGYEQWLDTTYTPLPGTAPERDEFTVVPAGALGAGPESHVVLTAVPEGDNGGGGCGWGYGSSETTGGVALPLRASCVDEQGDALSAEVVRQPEHGVVTPVVTTPGLYGWTDHRLAYTPTVGYEGVDCVVLRVTDGRGMSFDLQFDLMVRPGVVEPPPIEVPDPPVTLPDPPVSVPDPPVTVPDPPVTVPDPPVTVPDPPVTVPDPPVSVPDAPVAPPEPPPPPPFALPPSSPLADAAGKRSPVLTVIAGSSAAPEPPQPVTQAGPPAATREPSVTGQPPALTPAQQARVALRTRSVKLISRVGDARIYAARARRGRAVAVSCPVACTVRAARRRARVTPGRAAVLSVPRGGLRLMVADVRGPAGRVTIRLP